MAALKQFLIISVCVLKFRLRVDRMVRAGMGSECVIVSSVLCLEIFQATAACMAWSSTRLMGVLYGNLLVC